MVLCRGSNPHRSKSILFSSLEVNQLLGDKMRYSIAFLLIYLAGTYSFSAKGETPQEPHKKETSDIKSYSLPLSGSFGPKAGRNHVEAQISTIAGYCVFTVFFESPLVIKTKLPPPCDLMTHGHDRFLPRVSTKQTGREVSAGLHIVGGLAPDDVTKVSCSKVWQNLYLYWPNGFPSTTTDTKMWTTPRWKLGDLPSESIQAKEPPHCPRWLINNYIGGLP